jgi:tryptophanyl-tRNA synthetase
MTEPTRPNETNPQGTPGHRPRVLSGMRPTGALHLGHYHGALKNWVRMQDTHDCFYMVADWHALTTHYEDREVVGRNTYEMVIDWLAAGLDPDKAVFFIQSRVPQHAELFTLLAMGTPLGWLERVPTDILIYKADAVPVGEDQAPHVEMTREIARRFNHLYGREPGFEEKAAASVKKMSKDDGRAFEAARKAFQQDGKAEALEAALAIVARSGSLGAADRERLSALARGTGRAILPEPATVLTEASRLPGLDGAKMSKSYGNTIAIREDKASIEQKIKRMPTDPQRVRRTDPGNPERCPVWQFHLVYSDTGRREWVTRGCTTAGIGCLECKQPIIEAVLDEQQPMLERAAPYVANPQRVRELMAAGCARARDAAEATMQEVRAAVGLAY